MELECYVYRIAICLTNEPYRLDSTSHLVGGVFNAIVEPARSDALIGAIVMEDLDMIVDCLGQKVIPRESDSILTEVE